MARKFGEAMGNIAVGIPKLIGQRMQAQKEQKQMESFADALMKNNPDSPMHAMLADVYRSDLPFEKKSAMAKSLVGIDPFKMQQQTRLAMDSTLKRYNQRIKEEQAKAKDIFNYSVDERKASRALVDQLQHDRDELLGFKSANEDMFEDVDIEEPKAGKKPKWNPHNAKLQKKASDIYTHYLKKGYSKEEAKAKMKKQLEKEYEF
jgi:hypothetical protein